MIPLFEQYTQEFKELNLPYSFDNEIISEGDTIKLVTGEEFLVSSINYDSNGAFLEYYDTTGVVRNISSNEAIIAPTKSERKLFWYDAIKAIIAMDIIKIGGSFSGGGILVSGGIYHKWRNSIAKKLQGIRQVQSYNSLKSQCDKLSSILNSDKYLLDTFKELDKYPYIDSKFISMFIGKRANKKFEEAKKMRKQLITEIGDYILHLLSEDDLNFIKEINTITNQNKN